MNLLFRCERGHETALPNLEWCRILVEKMCMAEMPRNGKCGCVAKRVS
jgi:hypothetical protein